MLVVVLQDAFQHTLPGSRRQVEPGRQGWITLGLQQSKSNQNGVAVPLEIELAVDAGFQLTVDSLVEIRQVGGDSLLIAFEFGDRFGGRFQLQKRDERGDC